MNNITLGEKITFLVTEYHKNPQLFVEAFKCKCKFTNYLHDSSIYDETELEFVESTMHESSSYTLLGTGQFYNTLINERWIWDCVKDDIIIFAPESRRSNQLTYSKMFVKNTSYVWDFLDKDWTEEALFQESTVRSNQALETLELFLYLKANCKIAFKMNLRMFDIDEAVKVYTK